MAPFIPSHQYETYEALILSGQIEQQDVPAVLASDAEFASWYLARAEQRWAA